MFDRPNWVKGILGLAALAALAPASARGTTGGSFDVQWTDRVGNTHPLVSTQVSVYDVNNGVDTLVGTWVTDSSGRLNYTTNYTRAGGGALQLQLDIKAIVTDVGQFGANYGQAYTYRLPTTFAVNPNTFGTTYDAGAVTNGSDAGKAIGFLQGLKVANDYYESIGAQVSSVNGRFGAAWGNGSYMSGWNMTLGYDSWGAWDVAIHEYGHGIANANQLHITPTLGNTHAFNQNSITTGPTLGAAGGTQLAWQEGIATYMGTSALNSRLPSAIPGMPASDSNASYDRYSSVAMTTPDSSASFNVSLENKTGIVSGVNYAINGKGEGDELSVARVLWDLYDNTPGEALGRAGHADQLALGPQGVFNLLKSAGQNNNGRLNDLWRVARQSYGNTPLARSLLGDIFEANSVSSIPGAPGGVADGGSTTELYPTLAWTPQNCGLSDKFMVAVYSADWSSLLQLSPQINGLTSWQLTNPLGPGAYNWVVISNSVMQSAVSFNDSYWSGAASFVIVPEPTTLLAVALVTPALLSRRRRA